MIILILILVAIAYYLFKRYTVIVPFKVEYCIKPVIYGTKSLKWYSGDIANIKDQINKSVTYKQFKDCVDSVYRFKIRYSGFKKYGITVDKSVEELIEMIDVRYASVKHKKLFIF